MWSGTSGISIIYIPQFFKTFFLFTKCWFKCFLLCFRFCHWKELCNTFLARLTFWNSKHYLNPDICSYILLHSLPTSLSVLVMHFLLTNLQMCHFSHFPLINHIRPQFFIILPSQLLLVHPRMPRQ